MRPSNLYNEAIRKEIENITEEKVDDVAGSVEELATAVSTLAQTVSGIKPVPEVESTDNGKVLKAVYIEGEEGEEDVGTYGWALDDEGVKTFGGTTEAGTVVDNLITFLATDISPAVVAGDYVVQMNGGNTYIYKVTEVSGVYVYGDYTNRVKVAESSGGGATINELTYNLYNTQGTPVTVSDVYGKIGSYVTTTSNTLFPNNKALSEFKKASIKVRFKTVFGSQNAPAEVDLTNYFVIKEETTWDATAMAMVPKCLLRAITLYDAKQGPIYNFQDYLADMCIVIGTSNPDGGLYTAQLLDPVLVVEYF